MFIIKFSGYIMRIKFGKDALVVEQKKYAIKLVNAYIVPKVPLNKFKSKHYLFRAANIIKNIDRVKNVFSG